MIGDESRSVAIAFHPTSRLRWTELVRTSPVAIICFVVAAFLVALGQFFYKSGAEKTGTTISSYLFNARLLAGVSCYIALMALFVAAFKRGGALGALILTTTLVATAGHFVLRAQESIGR